MVSLKIGNYFLSIHLFTLPSMTHTSDFLIIGGGIFGLSAALSLRERQYNVTLINSDALPHPLAASTDISKIVRVEYGSDQQYFNMAMESIKGWETWNQMLDRPVYQSTGLLMLMQKDQKAPEQSFERESVALLQEAGLATQWLSEGELRSRYPAINTDFFPYAHFNTRAGYVASGEAIGLLAAYAKKRGVIIREGQTAQELVIGHGHLRQVKTREGVRFSAGQTIVAAGAYTPYLVPDLQPYLKATGHPVFHFRPVEANAFRAAHLPVFTADISNTGWYGFPYHPREGVVKIARHTDGLLLHPSLDDRRVTDAEVTDCRTFLALAIPALAKAPLVHTRRCLYTDTLDGHFWIDRHPEIRGLSVASGGSGHGMKMGPALGPLIADMAEGKENAWLARFRWRALKADTIQEEAARFKQSS